MRLVFAGSSAFALAPLRALAASSHSVLAVVTAPDRAGDRGRLAPRPVRDLARQLGLPVLQPTRLGRVDLEPQLAAGAELLVVCAYGQLIPGSILDAFPRGAVGVHPSLLPRHRGAAPVAAAILAGDRQTGVSIFRVERRLDAGPVLAARAVPLPSTATTPEVEAELAELGASLLVEVLGQMEDGRLELRAQDESRVTYAAKLRRTDGHLPWSIPAEEVDRSLRALRPWPGVTVVLAGAEVKLLRGGVVAAAGTATPGEELGWDGEALVMGTGAGTFRVELVQPPGGRPMTPAAFIRGRRRADQGVL